MPVFIVVYAMRVLKLFLQMCLVLGICAIISFATWCVYLVWWLIEGMR